MLVGLTQRIEVVADSKEQRDCLDKNWFKRLDDLNLSGIPVPNSLKNPVNWAKLIGVEALILTGGNDLSHLHNAKNIAPKRDAIENVLLTWSSEKHVPVLGVCRGMQLMNTFLGGSLSRVNGHVANFHNIKPIDGDNTFKNYQKVNSYHEWGINLKELATDLKPLAVAEDGTVEACTHKSLPWLGLMWHPERDNGDSKNLDTKLLKNFFLSF